MTGLAMLGRVALTAFHGNPLISGLTCQPRPGHQGRVYLGASLWQ